MDAPTKGPKAQASSTRNAFYLPWNNEMTEETASPEKASPETEQHETEQHKVRLHQSGRRSPSDVA